MTSELDLSPLDGQWVSATGLAGGLSRVRVRASGGDLMISARAAGADGEPGLGPVRARVFAAGARSAVGHALLADFDRGHARTHIQTYQALGLMVIHGFHRFQDRPGQAGYFTREFFVPDVPDVPDVSDVSGIPDVPGNGGAAGTPDTRNLAGTADPAALAGTWQGLAPPAAQQIATLEAHVTGGQLRVRAGAAEAMAQVYSDAHYPQDPPAFLATFEHDRSRVHVQARLNRGVLVVCEYTEFNDDSGRPGYFIRECYQR